MTQQNPQTPEAPEAVQVHPSETLTTPSGEHVRVDCGMAPLVA